MRKFISFLLCLIVLSSCLVFGGCTYEMVNLYIKKGPEKLVYQVGEELDLSGIELKNIKTDSSLLSVRQNMVTFSGFDSTTSGEKTVTATYGKFSASFIVYVANKVLTTEDNVVSSIESASDGDIFLLKAGKYNLSDTKIEITSKVIIGGESSEKTQINGYFLVGAYDNNGIQVLDNFSDVSFVNIGFNIESKIENNIVKYNNNYNKVYGALNLFDTKNVSVLNCYFNGYSYGILGNSAENLVITNCKFENLYLGGISIQNSTKDTIINKNIFQNIGNGVVYSKNGESQEYISAISLGFKDKGNAGTTLFQNSISKVGLNTNNVIYFGGENINKFATLNYIKNTAGIIIFSTSENNLQTTNISLSNNSIGACLNNVLYSTTESNHINSSSVMFVAP